MYEKNDFPDEDDSSSFAVLEKTLGHSFSDRSLLRRALTHSSSTPAGGVDNERLEFFGDAILDLIICEHLFAACPTESEGVLTEIKSLIVRRGSLAQAARTLDLRSHLILGRSLSQQKELQASVYANVFEALVAALYLDGGYAVTARFVLDCLEPIIAEARTESRYRNHKSDLQEYLQKKGREIPEYRILDSHGPDHRKTFTVAVFIGGEKWGGGEGSNKKNAEQQAAQNTLATLLEESAEGEEAGRD